MLGTVQVPRCPVPCLLPQLLLWCTSFHKLGTVPGAVGTHDLQKRPALSLDISAIQKSSSGAGRASPCSSILWPCLGWWAHRDTVKEQPARMPAVYKMTTGEKIENCKRIHRTRNNANTENYNVSGKDTDKRSPLKLRMFKVLTHVIGPFY